MQNKKLQAIISQFSESQKAQYEKMHPEARKFYEKRLLAYGCPPVEIEKYSFKNNAQPNKILTAPYKSA